MRIKNREQLLSHGDLEARETLLKIAEAALKAVDSYDAVKETVRLEGDRLSIGRLEYGLEEVENLYVIGAGKASMGMARALDEILGGRITEGLVIVKKGQAMTLEHIEIVEASHPVPDESGYLASKRILTIMDKTTENDLVLSTITGGSSALMSQPIDGISLEDERSVTDLLLMSGADIIEINSVRRHISATNGGRLMERAYPAELVNLIISDKVGDPPIEDPSRPRLFWGTPVCPDDTTLADGINTLRKYDLWEKTPISIQDYFRELDPAKETPKDTKGRRVHTFILRNLGNCCEAARRKGCELGYNSIVLSSMIEGESREAGIFLACIAREIETNYRPVEPPCVLVVGGENTVTIPGSSGEGGPSQELALGFALEIAGSKRSTILTIDTDGTDGPSQLAGGFADGFTVERAKNKGLDVYTSLLAHDSSTVLRMLDDALIAGTTNTNVCDLNLLVVMA
jgi:glycerate-2-kinase